MKYKIIFLLTAIIFAFGCQKVKQKIQHDLSKADSIANIVADSLNQKIKNSSDTTTYQKSTPVQQQVYNPELISNIYKTLLQTFKQQDTLLLYQFLYFPDSVLTITSKGIFQVLTLEPIGDLFAELNYNDSAWTCQVKFEKFPAFGQTGWTKQGCFIQPVKNFTKLSAVLQVNQEANIPIDPQIILKVKDVEPKIVYKALNTYLNWTFYFAYDRGKYYLAAIDFNQF